ncbi:hypothetical protein ABK040_007292 [Willaertia magna]
MSKNNDKAKSSIPKKKEVKITATTTTDNNKKKKFEKNDKNKNYKNNNKNGNKNSNKNKQEENKNFKKNKLEIDYSQFSIIPNKTLYIYSEKDKMLEIKNLQIEIKQISTGNNFTFILTTENKLYSFGNNERGQLGLNDKKNRKEFTKIKQSFFTMDPNFTKENFTKNNTTIKNIFCGNNFTILQTVNNELYGCGQNNNNQLALPEKRDYLNFTKINFHLKILKISVNENCIAILAEEDGFFLSGTDFEKFHFEKLKNLQNFGKIKNSEKLKDFVIGNDGHVLALNYNTEKVYNDIYNNNYKKNNEIYVFGRNKYGQLGTGTNFVQFEFFKLNTIIKNRIVKMLAGNGYSLLLTDFGELFMAGSFHADLNNKQNFEFTKFKGLNFVMDIFLTFSNCAYLIVQSHDKFNMNGDFYCSRKSAQSTNNFLQKNSFKKLEELSNINKNLNKFGMNTILGGLDFTIFYNNKFKIVKESKNSKRMKLNLKWKLLNQEFTDLLFKLQ